MDFDIKVREATEADFPQIVAFNLALAIESENLELDRAIVERGVRRVYGHRDWCRYYLAEVNGELIGQTLLTRDVSDWRDGYYYWIHSVYVVPEFRGRKVFRRLFDHVISAAKSAGDARIVKLYVDKTNARAIKTYEALGMAEGHYFLYELELRPSPVR